MACQTGIRANEKLREVFENAKQSKLRLVKVVVRNEELSPNYEYRGTDDWKKDWKATLPECVDSFEPCFVLFRLGGSHEWLLITFADDRAPTKEKMLLAATRATFKSEFGQSYIQHERHVVDRKDLTLDNQEEWLASKRNRDDRPLTEIEQELVSHAFFDSTWQVNAQQERISAIHAPNPLALRGVAFPIDRDAEDAIRSLVDGRLAFVQLSVDTLNEAIKLEAKEPTLAADQLASRIPRDKPRYQFYRFEHSFEDQLLSSIVFIYSLPSSGSSIKERMLYSSCKSPFLDAAQRGLGVELSKKIELDPREVLSEQALMDYLHPAASAPSAAFARPAPPARGGRRITKA